MQPSDPIQLLRVALDAGLTLSATMALFGERRTVAELQAVKAAQDLYQREGEIEVDDSALCSRSDAGYYVQAWVWVEDQTTEV